MSNSTYCDCQYEQPWWIVEIADLKKQVKQLTSERDKLQNEIARLRAKLRDYGCEL
jgi:regulator of replication initiation timing